MSKIKLGQRPQNFKKVIKFPMLDGTTGSIQVTYKYRTRREFGQFIDQMMDDAGVVRNNDHDAEFSMAELMTKTSGSTADYLLEVIEEWNLDVPLSKESAQQLADEYPAASMGIMETYRLAITEGRLGN
jgi:hypothetical protein